MPIMSAVWMPCAAPPAPWSTAPHARKSPSRCTVWRTVMPWKPWDFGSKSWMCLAILPSLMALEQDINPFLRVRQPAVAQAAHGYDAKVNQDDAVAVLAALRQWKNEFR